MAVRLTVKMSGEVEDIFEVLLIAIKHFPGITVDEIHDVPEEEEIPVKQEAEVKQ